MVGHAGDFAGEHSGQFLFTGSHANAAVAHIYAYVFCRIIDYTIWCHRHKKERSDETFSRSKERLCLKHLVLVLF